MDRCEECGFVYGDVDLDAVAARVESFGDRYRETFAGVREDLARIRPNPDTWSGLEYTCHIRDVLLVQRDRTVLAQVEDRPSFARMYREERVGLCRYADEPLTDVLDQLSMAAQLCATVFAAVTPDGWRRPLIYNWPSPAERDLSWLARHTVHEGEHHLMDVTRTLSP